MAQNLVDEIMELVEELNVMEQIQIEHEGSVKAVIGDKSIPDWTNADMDKLISEYGYSKAMKKINALFVLLKNSSPDLASHLESLKDYMKGTQES